MESGTQVDILNHRNQLRVIAFTDRLNKNIYAAVNSDSSLTYVRDMVWFVVYASHIRVLSRRKPERSAQIIQYNRNISIMALISYMSTIETNNKLVLKVVIT